jgi:catechol 2,3-dioxygenase-like lactoylglutathione lyase family enzyme
MSRLQLALTVSDPEAAVEFYSPLFRAVPAKKWPGYASFALAEPPLGLVLVEVGASRGGGLAGALNHLGVEVGSTEEVPAAAERLAAAGLETTVAEQTSCCYALQTKVGVNDPDGAPWEIDTVLADEIEARALTRSTGFCPARPEDQAARVGAGGLCRGAARN